MAQASSSGSSSNQSSGVQKVLVVTQDSGNQIYTILAGQTAQSIALTGGVTDPSLYEQFPESDFDSACYRFPAGFSLSNGVVSYSLTLAKELAVDITKTNHAAQEKAVTAGYSDTAIASQSGLPEGDRLPEIQAVISEVNFLAYQLSDNLAKIDAASDIETVYNIVQQPSGVINTGRGGTGQAGPLDLNLSYFVTLDNMPGYSQSDLELYVPGTDTVIPYDPELPAPYTFDSAGTCFAPDDDLLVVRYAGGGPVITWLYVAEGDNADVTWEYRPNIPGGSSSQS
jgi:hypothetical protein